MNSSEHNQTKSNIPVGENDCLTDHNTLSVLSDQPGEIVLLDEVNYGIRVKGNNNPLLPCNLPDSFQKAGKQIIFSGNIKEARLEEFWAGQPFVLTKISER